MSLLPTGINNKIIEYQAKSKTVKVFLNDAQNIFNSLDSYDIKFYMKKFPVKSSDEVITVYSSFVDVSSGSVTFNLFPIITDIKEGDYIYEVVIVNKYDQKTFTVVQDRLTILRSLDKTYGDIHFYVTPDSYEFIKNDLSTNMILNTASGVNWNVTYPNWLTLDKNYGVGSANINMFVNASTGNFNDIVYFESPYGIDTVDVSFYAVPFDYIPERMTFDRHTLMIGGEVFTPQENTWTGTPPSWINLTRYGDEFTAEVIDGELEGSGNIVLDSLYSTTRYLPVEYYYFNVTPNNIIFNLINLTSQISIVTPNTNNWHIEYPSWLTLDVSSGSGSATINATVSNTTQLRSGVISVISDYATLETTVNFYLSQLYVYGSEYNMINDIDRNIIRRNYNQQDLPIYLTTNQDNNWSLVPKTSIFFNYEPSVGTGDTVIDLNYIQEEESFLSVQFYAESDYAHDTEITLHYADVSISPTNLLIYHDTDYVDVTIRGYDGMYWNIGSILNIPVWMSPDHTSGFLSDASNNTDTIRFTILRYNYLIPTSSFNFNINYYYDKQTIQVNSYEQSSLYTMPAELNFTNLDTVTDASIIIDNNYDWVINNHLDFLTPSVLSGSGNTNVTFTLDDDAKYSIFRTSIDIDSSNADTYQLYINNRIDKCTIGGVVDDGRVIHIFNYNDALTFTAPVDCSVLILGPGGLGAETITLTNLISHKAYASGGGGGAGQLWEGNMRFQPGTYQVEFTEDYTRFNNQTCVKGHNGFTGYKCYDGSHDPIEVVMSGQGGDSYIYKGLPQGSTCYWGYALYQRGGGGAGGGWVWDQQPWNGHWVNPLNITEDNEHNGGAGKWSDITNVNTEYGHGGAGGTSIGTNLYSNGQNGPNPIVIVSYYIST